MIITKQKNESDLKKRTTTNTNEDPIINRDNLRN